MVSVLTFVSASRRLKIKEKEKEKEMTFHPYGIGGCPVCSSIGEDPTCTSSTKVHAKVGQLVLEAILGDDL